VGLEDEPVSTGNDAGGGERVPRGAAGWPAGRFPDSSGQENGFTTVRPPKDRPSWRCSGGFLVDGGRTVAPPSPRPVADRLGANLSGQPRRGRTFRFPRVKFRPLLEGSRCITLNDMKTSVLTVRLDPDLERRLEQAAKQSGRTRSEFVRVALRRQLALSQFEDLRRRIMPFAEAQGYLTDEDVFRDVS
jgi:predicted transcriptional regulator